MHMRIKEYKGSKRRFPINRYLDTACQDPLYITEYLLSLNNKNKAVGS